MTYMTREWLSGPRLLLYGLVAGVLLTIWWSTASKTGGPTPSEIRVPGIYQTLADGTCRWVFAWDDEFDDLTANHRVEFIEFQTSLDRRFLGLPHRFRLESINLRSCLTSKDRVALLHDVAYGYFDRPVLPIERRLLDKLSSNDSDGESMVLVESAIPILWLCSSLGTIGILACTWVVRAMLLRRSGSTP